MRILFSKFLFYTGCALACTMMAFNTGCASGGWKLTRQYAGFVNKQMIIIRIILYILTYIVFVATMLIDMVIFNTMDFWEGRVSQGTYEFKGEGKTFVAQHSISPETKLKQSNIKIYSQDRKLLQEVAFQETSTGEIEISVDGKLRSRVRNLSDQPVASIFDIHGQKIGEKTIPYDVLVGHSGMVAGN